MQEIAPFRDHRPQMRRQGRRRLSWIIAAGVLVVAASLLASAGVLMLGLASAGATLVVLGVLLSLRRKAQERREEADLTVIRSFIKRDATPSIVTNAEGRIQTANPAAANDYDLKSHPTLAGALKTRLANPGAILRRLQDQAESAGNAFEDILVRGGHLRLRLHQAGDDVFIWRIEPFEGRGGARAGSDGHALPMLMVGRNDAVLYMNDPARAIIGTRVKSLDRLFTSLPVRSGKPAKLHCKEGPQDVFVAEVPAAAGRRALFLLPLPEGESTAEQGEDWQPLQDLPVPLLKIGAEGQVTAFNRLAANLVGVGLQEGARLSELMEGLGRSLSDWIRDALEGRGAQAAEFLRLKRGDREVFVQVVLSRITESGAPGLVAVLHDATELKTLEAKFVQSQKMQAIGQLAGGVAHDFNNLLTAISGHCDLLLLRHDQSDADYADLVQINQNANRAAALVGQLLAFSRKQTLRFETIDMRDTLADLIHLLNRLVGEKITLTLSHDPDLKPVRADKRQLEQVLMNLVVNARDAMPAGGEIRIATEYVELAKPLERDRAVVPAGSYVLLQVRDEGVGIPQDKLQKVFEPFYTTKRTGEGTGLGLSTAYGIIKQSNGFIFVDSIPGKGTTFALYLPVQDVRPGVDVVKQPSPAASPPRPEEGVILLVEDEAPVRAFASRALRLRGFTVLEADSAENALKTLEDQSLAVDVFVTDVVMPGMDGPSWVREALKERPGVRVVFVSGYAEDSFGEAQTSIPNSVFLPKPFSLTDLTDTVQRQLH